MTVSSDVGNRACEVACQPRTGNGYAVTLLVGASLALINACSGVVNQTPLPTASPSTPAAIDSLQTTKHIVLASILPPKIEKPADLLFLDRFEYSVGRNDQNAVELFRANGHWTTAKTMQADRPGAHGYLYTSEHILGYRGAFPGVSSKRVLAVEALPVSQNGTDFYLQYGDGENPANDNKIPGNVWFQFWMYINYAGDQRSHLDARNKFIYACNGTYPCHSHKWMVSLGSISYLPHRKSLGSPSKGSAFINVPANFSVATVNNAAAPEWDRWKLGQTNTSEYIRANHWTLVKIHADTSTQSGKMEVWLRALGGSWVKVVEWIDGVTPGFSWKIRPEHVGGHRVIRMPTVFGPSHLKHQPFSAWIYMDDFAIAVSEQGLPVYGQ